MHLLGVACGARDTACVIAMQIVVRLADSPSEWGLVELQGVLETRQGRSFEGLHIGDLHFNSATGTASLIVGHHLLIGKAVTLEKPLAVLQKPSPSSSFTPEYHVSALIRRKLVFKNRPKPIVSAAAPKSS